MALNQEQIQEYRLRYGVGITPRNSTRPNFFERTATNASEGLNKIKTAFQESRAGKNPLSTGSKLGAGVIETALSPLTAGIQPVAEPTLGRAANAVVEKISDIPAVQEFATSKAGEVASGVAETVGNINTIAGAVAVPPTTSSVARGSLGTIDDLGREVARVAQTQAGSQPAKIMQRVARINKSKQANFEKMAGESVGEYLTKRGIYGNIDDISTKLYDRFTRSKDVADKALEKLPGTYEPAPVKTALRELLEREVRVSSEGAPSPNLARVANLYKRINEKGLTMTEINEAKRLYERIVRLDYVKQNLPESVARANNIDDAIRSWQFKQAETLGLKNLPAINRETRLAKQLLDDIGQEYSGQAGNNAFSLTDAILVSGGDPAAIAVLLTKKTFGSKTVLSAIAKALNKDRPTIDVLDADFGPSKVLNLPESRGGAPVQITKPILQPSKKAIDSGTEIVPRGVKQDRAKPSKPPK